MLISWFWLFRSPVFQSKLDKLVGDEHVIVVKDMEPTVFKAMLQYLYSDALPEDELAASNSSCSPISETFTAKLLAAADK